MTPKIWPILTFPLLFLACASPVAQQSPQLVNTAHLDHLYTEIAVGEDKLGAIWIYCEAPDYVHVGDDDEGFTCVDDVARALVFYSRAYTSRPSPDVGRKIRGLTRFLLHMRADNGYFYNFMFPDGTINTTHVNSRAEAGWWSWRAFWALAEMSLIPDADMADLRVAAKPAMDTLLARVDRLCPSPADDVEIEGLILPACLADLGADQLSVLLTALVRYHQSYPDESSRQRILDIGNLLLRVQFGDREKPPHFAFLSWRNIWHAWGNAQAYAILLAGQAIDHQPFIDAGMREVRSFYPYVMGNGRPAAFRVDCTTMPCTLRDVAQFPQIAYGQRPMILAALEAYRVTGDTLYAGTAAALAAWFFGSNAAGQPMYDVATGRTYDGLNGPADINHNAGAESTIEGLLTLQAIQAFPDAKAALDKYLAEPKE